MSGHKGTVKSQSDIESLFAEMGFETLTEIQKKAVPKILQKRDCLVIAPTGSGKTECAVLPIFHRISADREPGRIRCLYITPLRALNRDVFRRITRYAEQNGLTIQIRHGDTTQTIRRKIAESPPDVLITTPETTVVLLSQPKMLKALSGLRWVIVDEVHELLPNERGSQLALSLERLQVNSDRDLTRIGLSATVGDPVEAAKFVAGTRRKCITIRDASVRRYDVTVRFEKGGMPAVADAVSSHMTESGIDSPVLLFANTRGEAELLASLLRSRTDIPVEMHHGSLSKQVREETESALRGGKRGIVVCTSSLELGLDIGSVELVIHYGSPRQVSKLVQRIGRSRHSRSESARGLVITNRPDDEFEARAILDRVSRGSIERHRAHRGPLDVLAHHLVGLAIQEGVGSVERALAIAKAAYPFRGTTTMDVCEVLDLLADNHIVLFDRQGLTYRTTGRSSWYHFENLSTIPDMLKFRVFDSVGKKIIGTLDQRFVGDNGEAGNIFVLRGSQWRILSVDEQSFQVNVEPFGGGGTNVPYWEGENIPVDHATAGMVGDIRRGSAAGDISMECGMQFGEVVPDGKTILVESNGYRGIVVVHACFGTRANLTLAAALSSIISSSSGSPVQSRSDAYRIVLTTKGRITEEMVREALADEYDLDRMVTASLAGTHNVNWRVWTVAKRFGVLSKGTVYERKTARFLYKRYAGTPLVREAMRELFHDKYDIPLAERILEEIRNGSIPVHWEEVEEFSKMAEPVLDHTARQYSAPPEIDPEILEMVKSRLQKTRHRLLCARCGRWQRVMETRQVTRVPSCPYCKARQITATFYSDYDLAGIISKKRSGGKLSAEENHKYKRAWKVSSLIETFGKSAIIVLSGYGVGADTGARILRNMVDENHMFRQIYEAERQYVLTRGFWDP